MQPDKDAACSHRRIAYVEIHRGNGSTGKRWDCEFCRQEFEPRESLVNAQRN